MKNFKPFGKSFSFPTSADASSRGSVTQQMVRPHFRTKATPKFAEGGLVGNSAVKRTEPTTVADAQHGGKGPLRTGYAKGGAACGPVVKKAISAHVAAPAPKGHKGLKKG